MAGTNFLLNSYNVGTDISVSISDDQGNQANAEDLGKLMEFEATEDDVENTIHPITDFGVPEHITIPRGWTGRMTFTRMNGALIDMLINRQASWYNGGIAVGFTITATVMNRDQSFDQYQFNGVAFSKGGFGNFRAEKEVDQQISFRAQLLTKNNALYTSLGQAAALVGTPGI
jgi:hypothetical protein